MAIPTAYLTTTGKLAEILENVKKAGDPPKFTYEFLKQLGYTSSVDRPVVAVLKALGFLTDSGQPTERYRRYKEPAKSKAVMAEALREAYADVFTVDQEAHKKSVGDLKGLFGRLSGKSESVNEKMASTFKALADQADFGAKSPATQAERPPLEQPPAAPPADNGKLVLRHDVHIHLPTSTDIAVYDAIFKSLRQNLG